MELLEVIHGMPKQIREAIDCAAHIKIAEPVDNIIICGMGGSGIAGDIVQELLQDAKIPIFVNKSYSVPGFVGRKTLAFIVSYSGDTEETLACFKECKKRGAQIVAVASGGQLRFAIQEHDLRRLVTIPSGYLPRAAVCYLVFSILTVIYNSKLASVKLADIKATIDDLQKKEYDSKARELANQLYGKIPVIYAADSHKAVVLRWKQQFNENSKFAAYWNVFSELNHNEMVGFKQPRQGFHFVLLRDEAESSQMKKRIELTKGIIKQAGYQITELMIGGTSPMVKMFAAIYIGDLASYYLAQKYNVNPADNSLIDDFKKKL